MGTVPPSAWLWYDVIDPGLDVRPDVRAKRRVVCGARHDDQPLLCPEGSKHTVRMFRASVDIGGAVDEQDRDGDAGGRVLGTDRVDVEGLGGEVHDLVVVLSSRATYRTWVIPTMTPGAEDFLALPDRGHCAIVKTTYVSNEDQSERSRRHSYWVYNLIAVRGDELVVANPLYAGFPK
jgi:hypothetical protein